MANQTIPGLPLVTALNGSEQFWAVQNGGDVRLTSGQLAAFFGGLGGFTALMNAYLASLPTTLPATPGQPWLNGNVVCVS